MSTSGILTDAAMVPQPGSSVSLDAVFNILSNLKLVTVRNHLSTHANYNLCSPVVLPW